MKLEPKAESELEFLKTTQTTIRSNGLAKFLVLGGAAASAVNGFVGNVLFTGLLESIGIATAAWITSQALKSGQNMEDMSNEQLNKHMTKGAFLAVGGIVVSAFSNFLPRPLAHLVQFPGSIALAAGAVAVIESGYQKVKRHNR